MFYHIQAATTWGVLLCELGAAEGIRDTIQTHLKSKSAKLSAIVVVEYDGAVANSDVKAGINCLLEQGFNKPLQ